MSRAALTGARKSDAKEPRAEAIGGRGGVRAPKFVEGARGRNIYAQRRRRRWFSFASDKRVLRPRPPLRSAASTLPGFAGSIEDGTRADGWPDTCAALGPNPFQNLSHCHVSLG